MAIARQVASGLKAAHDAGVVHRDLKPANVMIEKDAEAIIMDFGIARTASSTRRRRRPPRATARRGGPLPALVESELTRVTATRKAATMAGAIVGTIAYMAPEQARGEEVDQRVDIYAFGLILYDLLLGRRRVDDAAGGAVADLQKRLEQALPPVKSVVPEVPEPLNRFVARCIEPEAAKRFALDGRDARRAGPARRSRQAASGQAGRRAAAGRRRSRRRCSALTGGRLLVHAAARCSTRTWWSSSPTS